jgi:hypothetical protein
MSALTPMLNWNLVADVPPLERVKIVPQLQVHGTSAAKMAIVQSILAQLAIGAHLMANLASPYRRRAMSLSSTHDHFQLSSVVIFSFLNFTLFGH